MGAKIKDAMKKELVSSKVNARMFPVLRDVDLLVSMCDGLAGEKDACWTTRGVPEPQKQG